MKSAFGPARTELLDWIFANERQRRLQQSFDRMKSEQTADVADVEYLRLVTPRYLEFAFRCVYKAYLDAGLIEPNGLGLRVTPHQLLPTSEILAAVLRQEVISTLTLVQDGALGLPAESLYEDEVQQRRLAGLTLAEVTCLADRRKDFRRRFRVLFRLMCLVIQTAAQRGVDELLIAVHPRHAAFYQRRFGFHVIADVKEYALVRNNLALLLSLDLNLLPTQHPEEHARIFEAPLPPHLLELQPIPPEVRKGFEHAAC
jgi:hypothetical protein